MNALRIRAYMAALAKMELISLSAIVCQDMEVIKLLIF